MSPRAQIVSILDELDLRLDSYFIGGSGPLALRDMRSVGDIDIGVTTAYWFDLQASGDWRVFTTESHDPLTRCDPPYLYRVVQGVEVHVFFAWCLRDFLPAHLSDYNVIFREHTEWVAGWRCVKLPLLLRLKSCYQRRKDLSDIVNIAARILGESRARV